MPSSVATTNPGSATRSGGARGTVGRDEGAIEAAAGGEMDKAGVKVRTPGVINGADDARDASTGVIGVTGVAGVIGVAVVEGATVVAEEAAVGAGDVLAGVAGVALLLLGARTGTGGVEAAEAVAVAVAAAFLAACNSALRCDTSRSKAFLAPTQ
jgi:hypothetical protein